MNYSEAADELRRVIRGFKNIEKLPEALDMVASMQNAEKEAELRLAKLTNEYNALLIQVNDAKETVQTANAEGEALKAAAKKAAAEYVAESKSEAAKIIDAAESKCKIALSECEAAKAELANIKANCRDAQDELMDIGRRLAQAKKQVAAIFG